MLRKSNTTHPALRIFIVSFILFSCVLFLWKYVINIVFFFGGEAYLSLFGVYDTLIVYNQLIEHRGSGNLDSIMTPEYPIDEAERLELIGDILYVQSGSLDEILSWYRKSLAHAERARVIEKLERLNTSDAGGDALHPDLSSSGADTRDEVGSGVVRMLDEARERLSEDEKNRGNYLDRTPKDALIRDTIDFLDLSIERPDW